MEDSSLFMQWALSTLQDEHPPGPASGDGFSSSSLPDVNNMVPSEPPPREGNRATSSWSSGWSPSQNSAIMYAAPLPSSGATSQPVSWNFSSASARPSKEATMRHSARSMDDGAGMPLIAQESLPTRRAAARSSGSPYVHYHILAERKRREKINERFIELSTVIPGLKKMDKATILSDATRYVKELQEKLKVHEEDGSSKGHRNTESAVIAKKKPRITVPDDEDGGSPSDVAAVVPAEATTGALPEIETRISEGNVMVRIHCEHVKGSLVKLLAVVEELHLTIVHANAMPLLPSTMIINIMAKVKDFNSTTADDIVGRLRCALNGHSINSKERTKEAAIE